jgi:hypothetical protein
MTAYIPKARTTVASVQAGLVKTSIPRTTAKSPRKSRIHQLRTKNPAVPREEVSVDTVILLGVVATPVYVDAGSAESDRNLTTVTVRNR